MVLTGTVLTTTSVPNRRSMLLLLGECLRVAIIRLGSSSDDEVAFMCHFDSYAVMNTANLTLYQWIITTYPAIVESYEQLYDSNPFHQIGLDCAVLSANASDIADHLSTVVIYKTQYTNTDNKPVTFSF